MKKNAFHILFVILFGAILTIPLFRSFSKVDESTAWMEKRELSTFPPVTWKKLKNFSTGFNQYFNDRLGFRKYIILAHAYLKNNIIKVSSNPDKVIMGKNGWLFLNTDNFCEDYYMNIRPFTEIQLKTISNDIYNRYSYLKEKNIDYYLFILPSKHAVYPEYMPDYIHKYDTISRLNQVQDYLKTNFNYSFYSLLDTMLQTKNDYPYYFDKDTHWNLNGAAFAYTIVLDELKTRYPDLNTFKCMEWDKKFAEFKNQGDLSLQMGRWDYKIGNHVVNIPPKDLKIESKEIDIGELPEKEKFLGPAKKFRSDQKDAPKVVFLRDSYTNLNMHYFAATFSESLFIWTHQFTPQIINNEKPDIVIELMAERFLSELD